MPWTPYPTGRLRAARLGWSPEGPPRETGGGLPGWDGVAQLIGTGTSIGDSAARVAMSSLGTATSIGDSAATVLANLIGTGTPLSDSAATVLAHLAGTGTSVGDSAGRAAFPLTGIGTSLSDAAATVLAQLQGTGISLGDSAAAVLAHLAGGGTATGDGAAASAFSAHAPARTDITATGAYTYNIPGWSRFIDQVIIGGAASGQTGNGAIGTAGKGGNAAIYVVRTLERGVDIPWSQSTITGTVGTGGAQAANSDSAAPNPGGDTTADWGSGSITSPGGSGTVASGQNGASSTATTVSGQNYPSGAGGTGNAGAGSAPGGAGAGGNGGFFGSRTRGGPGGNGRASFYARQS